YLFIYIYLFIYFYLSTCYVCVVVCKGRAGAAQGGDEGEERRRRSLRREEGRGGRCARRTPSSTRPGLEPDDGLLAAASPTGRALARPPRALRPAPGAALAARTLAHAPPARAPPRAAEPHELTISSSVLGWNESTDSGVLLRHRPSILVEEDSDIVSSQPSSASVRDPFPVVIKSSSRPPVSHSEIFDSPRDPISPSELEPLPKEPSCQSVSFASRTESVSRGESFTLRNESLLQSDSFASSLKSFPSNDVRPLPQVLSDAIVTPKEPFPPSDSFDVPKDPIPSTDATAPRHFPPVSAFLSESFVQFQKPFPCSKNMSSRQQFLRKMCSITDWGCANPLCKCERCMVCGDESKAEDPFFTEVKVTESPRRPPRRTRECRLGPDACSRVRVGRILSDVNDEEEPATNITSQEDIHPQNVGSTSPVAISCDSLTTLDESNRASNESTEPTPRPCASPIVQCVSSSLSRGSITLPSDSISLRGESPPKPNNLTTAASDSVSPPCDSSSALTESLSVADAPSDASIRPVQSTSLPESSTTTVASSEVQLRVKRRPVDGDSFPCEGLCRVAGVGRRIGPHACRQRKSTTRRVRAHGGGRGRDGSRRGRSASLFASRRRIRSLWRDTWPGQRVALAHQPRDSRPLSF
ncbi:Protein of unknown function, partial [Gryllus bimaculatus]